MSEITQRLSTAIADRYRIERHLGQGGMATVYLAEDVRHKRKVALKVLRPELAAVIGAERFLQEITVTANLQHPNILALYDSGEADTFLFYVMPFVEGDTLRDKLDREKQLPLDEAVEITKSVAAALDYAHRQNVIHRDIKPENILIHDGQALVADFGIALAVSEAGGSRLTETGLSLGTPHYMSPEQAMGDRELDARSDVYSLGAMLYEMLAGEPPYTGNTAQAIVARVITEDPRSLTLQRRTVPQHVAAAVHKSLSKLPADRFATAAQFAEALGNPAFAVPTTAVLPSAGGALPVWRRFVWPGVALVAVAAALFGWFRPGAQPVPVMRQRIVLGSVGGAPFSVLGGTAIAPDGSAIVFIDSGATGPQLWIKERDQRDPAPLAGADGATAGVDFSPDGEWIAYASGGQLKKIPRRGGAPVMLSDSAGGRPAWLDDGTIVYADQVATRLFRVSSDGGVPERLLAAQDVGRGIGQLIPLPNARALLFTGLRPTLTDSDLMLLDLQTGEISTLVAGAGWGAYSQTGHLLYALRNGGLWAAPFDLDGFQVGQAVPLEDGIRTTLGLAEATLGRDGTLLYVRGQGAANLARLEWVDRRGSATAVDPDFALRGANITGGIRLSPDGNRVVTNYQSEGGEAQFLGGDVYVKRLPTGPAARITFEGVSNRRPSWSPDGTNLLFVSNRGDAGDNVWIKRADGGGTATLLLDRPRHVFEAEWSPDGRWLVYRTDDDQGGEGRGDILAIRTDGDTTPVPLVASPAEETGPAVSWDSRWLAYASDETGRKEIYVRPFPNTEDGKWLVSTAGGSEAAWARSGRELFYRDAAGNMVVTTVAVSGGSFEVLERQVLFNAQGYLGNDDHRFYDVSADGGRFIMISLGACGGGGDLIMVTNLHEVLRGIGR